MIFKKKKIVTLLLIGILLLLTITACSSKKETTIKVGGKNFTEQYIMAQMLSILIEENTDLKTEIKDNLSANVAFEAIKSEEMDMYMEYIGSALSNMHMELEGSTEYQFNAVKEVFAEEFNIKWFDPLGFTNSYAMVVTKETAEKYNLKNITDMAEIANELTLGCTYIFTEREDGAPGLTEHYDFTFKDIKGMDAALMYQALVQGSVDVISGFTTEGRIPAFDLVVLDDDKQFFPPYDASIIVRNEILAEHPELEEIISRLTNRIDQTKMAELNAKVDLDKRDPEDVAREFLEKEGLI